MSDTFFSHIFSLAALGLLWTLNTLLLWALNRQWWQMRPVRRMLWMVPLAGVVSVGIWALGTATGWSLVRSAGSTLSTIVLTLSAAVLLALPLSGIALTIDRMIRRFAEKRRVLAEREGRARGVKPSIPGERGDIPPSPSTSAISALPDHPIGAEVATAEPERTLVQPVATSRTIATSASAPSRMKLVPPMRGADRRRRSFLTKTAAAIPLATLGAASYGLFRAQGPVLMPEIPLVFPGLHPDLDGLRILHLSDIHIGYYVDLDDLEKVMRSAEAKRPDMVLVSGDISDDVSALPDTLRLIASLNPRYGTFASLGNHEYFRGINDVVRIIEASPVPLLRDTGASVKIGGAELYIGGADDPVRMAKREENYRFLRKTVHAAFNGAPSDAFHILMSHRPQGFDIAADDGVELTVSGHTHGAQIGINGRSILEPWMRDHYLWGHYKREGSHLYTSSGVGHWFPFRLGCPPEAPVYVLRKA